MVRDFLIASGFAFQGDFLVLPNYCKTVKFDVGLSVNAPQSAAWLAQDPGLFVFGFEPVSKNRDAIMTGVSSWPTNLDPNLVGERIEIIPCALGSSSNPNGMKMYITKLDPGCSSLLEPIDIEVDYFETVPVFTLENFLKYFPFQQIPLIDHLKIDVQGTDIEVLKGLGMYMDRFMAITIEIDIANYRETQNSQKGVIKLLRAQGFRKIRSNRIAKFYRNLRGYQIELEVDDPTFINSAKIGLTRTRRFFIFQRG